MTKPHRYPPTPWLSQVHPLTQAHYKFRISRTRLNGQFVVTLARDSPTSPNETRTLRPSRPGWWPFVQACDRLLDLAQWDPDTNPDGPAARSQWNKDKKGYTVMSNDVDVLTSLLPQLISGASRKSLKKTLQQSLLASTVNSTDVRHVASRTNRFTEIMNATHKALIFLNPALDRMQDARRMKGYGKDEIESMRHCLGNAIQALLTAQKIARTGNATFNEIYKSGVMPQRTALNTNKFEVNAAGLNDEESSLSPQEQAIQVRQRHAAPNFSFDDEPPVATPAHNESEFQIRPDYAGEKFHPGTDWATAGFLRYQGWNEDDIAASQRAGRERGKIKDVTPVRKGGFMITNEDEQ